MSEKEHEFLDRIGKILKEDEDPQINALDVDRLYKACLRWRKMETEAAKYVESVICLRSHRFTGMPPYVGWEGLGLALREDYDEIDRLRAERDEADRRAGTAERELTHYRDRVNKLEAAFWWMFEVNPKIKDGLATILCTEEQWREAKAMLAAPTLPKE